MYGVDEPRAPGKLRAAWLPLLGVLVVAIVVGAVVRHFDRGRSDAEPQTVLPFGN